MRVISGELLNVLEINMIGIICNGENYPLFWHGPGTTDTPAPGPRFPETPMLRPPPPILWISQMSLPSEHNVHYGESDG